MHPLGRQYPSCPPCACPGYVYVCVCLCEVFACGLLSRGAGGAIVNVSSQASTSAQDTDHSVYCSSKAAVDQLTRCLAFELGPHQVSTLTYVLTPKTSHSYVQNCCWIIQVSHHQG